MTRLQRLCVLGSLPLLTTTPMTLNAFAETVDQSSAPAGSALHGTWFELPLDCPFCSSFQEQTISLSRDTTIVRYSDRLEIATDLKSARFITRTHSAESNEHPALALPDSRKERVVFIQYATGDGKRTSDMFARVWVLSPLGDGMLLYGRRYLISAFTDEGFEPADKGYKARQKFLPVERLVANLEDVRVYGLNETRKVYQPSPQVRFALEGAVCFLREGTTEAHILRAKEQSQALARERASREALFKTLVQQGDRAYATANYEDALNRYKAASALLPELAIVHADLGAVYQVQNKLPEAEAAYRLGLELEPTDIDSRYNLALVLEQAGRVSEAVEQFREVLSARPNDAEAKDHAARLADQLNR